MSSTLGEIRAYGYLLEAGITAISERNEKPTPEFNMELDGGTNIVEVHSK
ncbi:hypothetical protein [Virgibacillus ainsalahensis]